MSHEDREAALLSWKERYNEQRKALADMQVEMIDLIKSNNNSNKQEELFLLLDQHCLKYNFTTRQKNIAKEAIQLFLDEHGAVHALREKYPDDKELFLNIFGDKPFGQIKIEEDPISLFIACSNVVDFSKIYNVNKGTLAKIKFILKSYFSMSGTPSGVQMKIPIPEIKGGITATDLSQKAETNTRSHEEQHAIYGLLAKAYNRAITAEELIDPEKKEVEENLREEAISAIYGNIENELLAQVAGGESPDEATGEVIFSYLYRAIDCEIKNLTIGLMDAQDEEGDNSIKQIQEDKINKVIEYLRTKDFYDRTVRLIGNSMSAITLLTDNDYSQEQILALFSNENIENWSKLANRLVKSS